MEGEKRILPRTIPPTVRARIVQPMGESQNPGVARLLLCSPKEGRDARARVGLNLRNQVLSLAGGRRSSPERDREGLPRRRAAGYPLERD